MARKRGPNRWSGGVYQRRLSTGPEWYIRYRVPPTKDGKLFRERVGPGDEGRDKAKILLGQRVQDIRHGHDPALRRVQSRMFEAVVDEFEQKYVSLSRDPDTYMDKVRVIRRAFEGRTLQAVTSKAIDDFISERQAAGSKGATCNRLRAVLSRVFSWSIDRGYYSGPNPARKVKRFAESPGRIRFLTRDEAARLIEKAPKHLKDAIICALHTGGRRREVLTLSPDDVDLDRRVLYFNQTNTKSGKQREIPIDDILHAVLKERLKVRRLKGSGREYLFTYRGKPMKDVRTAFNDARKRADLVKDVTFHVLRHTFASWYMINGGDLYRLQKYLGHSTIALTQRYAHLSAGYMQEGARFFGPPAPIKAGDPQVIPGAPDSVSDASSKRRASR